MRALTCAVAVSFVLGAVGCSAGSSPESPTLAYRPVDEEARKAALESLKVKSDEVAAAGGERAAQNEAIARHARTLADVAQASPSADGVVGVFFDGQPFVILNNVHLGDLGSSSQDLQQAPEPRNLGSGRHARLMNGFSADFPENPNPAIAAMLRKVGYVPVETGASVEDFKKISAEAVLHIRTHGGGGEVVDASGKQVQEVDDKTGKGKVDDQGKPVFLKFFGLWTTDPADAANLARYQEEVAARRLIRMYEVVYPCRFDFCTDKQWHLGIADGFVVKHWGAMAPGAYIHVSACSTAGSEVGNQAFREAIQNKSPGSVYLGWTQPAVVQDMDRAAKFLFDRLAGANLLDTSADPKESPPQRPFDLQSMAAQMTERKMMTSATATLSVFPDGAARIDRFLLAPSISKVRLFESEGLLILDGQFGPDGSKASITVGGESCPVQDWESREVSCKLAPSAQGEVLVTVDGIESNRVKLSSWRGKFTYAVESDTPGLSQVWTLKLHLRGDVGDYRNAPGQKPVAHQKVISLSKDSAVTVVGGGAVTADGCGMTWEPRSVSVTPWAPVPAFGDGYTVNFEGVVDADEPSKLWLELYGWADPCYDRSATSDHGCAANSPTGRCAMPVSPELGTTAPSHSFGAYVASRLNQPATIGPDGRIAAGQIAPAGTTCCGGELAVPWDYQQRAFWEAMTPESGPDPEKDVR